jgi:hypothetical protein
VFLAPLFAANTAIATYLFTVEVRDSSQSLHSQPDCSFVLCVLALWAFPRELSGTPHSRYLHEKCMQTLCGALHPQSAAVCCAQTTVCCTLLSIWQVTSRASTALLAAAFVGIVPSYISRSVAGSYDNEGVAIFALIFTFYFWVKVSLRLISSMITW